MKKKILEFLSENFQFLKVKFSIYMHLNRCVFIMDYKGPKIYILPYREVKGGVLRAPHGTNASCREHKEILHHENMPI